jgi:hypothetical protein
MSFTTLLCLGLIGYGIWTIRHKLDQFGEAYLGLVPTPPEELQRQAELEDQKRKRQRQQRIGIGLGRLAWALIRRMR